MRSVSRLLALVLVTGGVSPARAEMPAITADNVFDFYVKFVRFTREPHQVNPTAAALCTTQTPAAIEEFKRGMKRQTGPHFDGWVHFYGNELAVQRTEKTEAFLPGAIIVKEKLGVDHHGALAIGGMRKREPGYDPANGDWEYFYSARKGDFSIGKIDSCVQCHKQTKGTDYVFAHWPAPKKS
jgi:hypothetical protein